MEERKAMGEEGAEWESGKGKVRKEEGIEACGIKA
jgi:hypothetical protein